MQSILNWILNVAGKFLLNLAVKFLEGKWPGLKPIIDKILEILGQDVPAAVLSLHLDQLALPKKV